MAKKDDINYAVTFSSICVIIDDFVAKDAAWVELMWDISSVMS